jgi:hypothetical protein
MQHRVWHRINAEGVAVIINTNAALQCQRKGEIPRGQEILTLTSLGIIKSLLYHLGKVPGLVCGFGGGCRTAPSLEIDPVAPGSTSQLLSGFDVLFLRILGNLII